MKKQVIVIHGGDSFNTYDEYLNSLKNWEVSVETFKPKMDWKTNLPTVLGENYDVLQPIMPNKQNARFVEWKIWFVRMIPYMYEEVILIGHSLGAMFLVKYLAENKLPKKISQLHLVATPHNKTADVGDFLIQDDLSNISKQVADIFLYHSQDDTIVPITELDIFIKQLPQAKVIKFADRGHFNQAEFPELIKNIIH